jgi:hydrogenase 3 maturation protease
VQQALKKILKDRLCAAKNIAVLGIGSALRGDDAAGTLAAENLKRSAAKKARGRKLKVFLGSTAPENLTGEIKRFKPSHLIIIDTADLRKKPGSVFVFKPESVGQGVSFSTHKMPAKILVDYLVKSTGCEATIIGIQPESVDFGRPPSKAAVAAARKTALAIAEAIR